MLNSRGSKSARIGGDSVYQGRAAFRDRGGGVSGVSGVVVVGEYRAGSKAALYSCSEKKYF